MNRAMLPLVVGLCGLASAAVNYSQHSILTARLDHSEQIDAFHEAARLNSYVQETKPVEFISKCAVGSNCMLRVSPSLLPAVVQLFSATHPPIAHHIVLHDLQLALHQQRLASDFEAEAAYTRRKLLNQRMRRLEGQVSPPQQRGLSARLELDELRRQLLDENLINWNNAFHKYEDISSWLDTLAKEYPAIVQVVVVGRTYEGMEIKGARIGWLAAPVSAQKSKIFMDGCVHAREWISAAVVQFMITRLIRAFVNKEAALLDLLLHVDWYLVPVLNVDGYRYSWEHDRMQRKNRQPNAGHSLSGNQDCVGTDVCRNADAGWGDSSSPGQPFPGASARPCDEDFMGVKPWSSPEAAALKNFLTDLAGPERVLRGYINFHSYNEAWLNPYGYTGRHSPDYAAQESLCRTVLTAIKAHGGHSYKCGPAFTAIYQANGILSDWAYDGLGVKYAQAVELRGSDFIVPASGSLEDRAQRLGGLGRRACYGRGHPRRAAAPPNHGSDAAAAAAHGGACAPPLLLGTLPHDTRAFTEGFFVHELEGESYFYESNGLTGQSDVRRVDMRTGSVLVSARPPSRIFGEGLALCPGDCAGIGTLAGAARGEVLIELSWHSGKSYLWHADTLAPVRVAVGAPQLVLDIPRTVRNEGWGMTTNGTHLIVSDGSAWVFFWQVERRNTAGAFWAIVERRRIQVLGSDGRGVTNLNELEWIGGSADQAVGGWGVLLANKWMTNKIYIIDLGQSRAAGKVLAHWDLPQLRQQAIAIDSVARGGDAVLNGIAWRQNASRTAASSASEVEHAKKEANRVAFAQSELFLVGKLWPVIFRFQLDISWAVLGNFPSESADDEAVDSSIAADPWAVFTDVSSSTGVSTSSVDAVDATPDAAPADPVLSVSIAVGLGLALSVCAVCCIVRSKSGASSASRDKRGRGSVTGGNAVWSIEDEDEDEVDLGMTSNGKRGGSSSSGPSGGRTLLSKAKAAAQKTKDKLKGGSAKQQRYRSVGGGHGGGRDVDVEMGRLHGAEWKPPKMERLPVPAGEFGEGERVWYQGSSGECERVEVLKVHREDVKPYYTVLMSSTGRERQTDSHRLSRTESSSDSNADGNTKEDEEVDLSEVATEGTQSKGPEVTPAATDRARIDADIDEFVSTL